MEKQRRGWWIVGLATALMAPSLTGPVSAGPFDYVQKADPQKNQSPSQSQQQAQEQRRQADGQEQQRRQSEARQAQERQAQERQRAAQEGARQEQERRAAAERQAAEARQRQATQQAEQQRQVERARAAQEASQRQRAEQERAQQAQRQQQAQQQRLREEQAASQQARRAQAEQAQREQPQVEQTQREQARRVQEAQQQAEGTREEQRGLVRPVASGPFDYIRKADGAKNPAPANAPQAPARRPGPAPAGAPARPQPFNAIPGAFPNNPRIPGSTVTPSTPAVRPGVRPSPFGSVRGDWPFTPTAPRPQVQTPRPQRNYGTDGTRFPRTAPANPVLPAPFGSVRGQIAPGTAVTPAPVPRGGHGTLGSYFNRPPRPKRPRRSIPGPYYGYGYYPYAPGYYYVSPYDLYPPTLYYPYPAPSPAPAYVPQPEIIPEPEPYYIEPGAPGEAEAATLEEVIGDIEAAWESGKLSLLMRHVRPGAELQIYRDGQWVDTLSRSQFEQKTQKAFRDYDTASMTFEKPELLGPDETGAPRARARATHVYSTRSGGEQRVHVTYAFRKYGSSWYVIGLDYEPTARADAAAPLPPPAAPVTHAAPAAAPDGRWALVSAPPVRLHDLLKASQPHTVATVKWLRGGSRSLYTLQAMRGVVPGTIAWALYPKGHKQPTATGVVTASAMPANGWVAVRPEAPQLVTLSSRATPRARMAHLTLPAFPAAAGLALVPAKPPAKSTNAKPGHKRHTTHARKARRK